MTLGIQYFFGLFLLMTNCSNLGLYVCLNRLYSKIAESNALTDLGSKLTKKGHQVILLETKLHMPDHK